MQKLIYHAMGIKGGGKEIISHRYRLKVSLRILITS